MSAENGVGRQGAVIGGWVCLGLGTALMFWTLFSFLLYLPLFIAAFVLGIVAIAQRRIGHGIPVLLLSVVIPIVFGFGLAATRATQALEEARSAQPPATIPNQAQGATSAVSDEHPPKAGPSAEDIYIQSNLELYDFRAKYMNAILDGRVPGVDFKIKNKGDKTLSMVKVVVHFKDASGAVIAEDDFTPVLVSKYNFGGDHKPLKPGYIWQQERGSFYTSKSVPTEWKEGSADAKITEIKFGESAD